jgi:hypothetical protein
MKIFLLLPPPPPPRSGEKSLCAVRGGVRRKFLVAEGKREEKEKEKAGKWGPLDWEKLRKINM